MGIRELQEAVMERLASEQDILDAYAARKAENTKAVEDEADSERRRYHAGDEYYFGGSAERGSGGRW